MADSKPDVYWLVVSGLRPVIDLHGKESASTMEALSLLNDALNELSKSFVNVYNDKVSQKCICLIKVTSARIKFILRANAHL